MSILSDSSYYYEWLVVSHNAHQSQSLNTLSIPSDTNTFDLHIHFGTFLESSHQFYPSEREHVQFRLERNWISSDEAARTSAIRSVIVSAVPFGERWLTEDVVPELSGFIFEMLSEPSNREEIMLSLSVFIGRFVSYDEEELMERVLRLSVEDNDLGFRPASKAFIHGLETVRVEEDLVVEDCVICLEKHLAGEEVSVLPCKHVFHGDCIVKWLETSHLCPLCRFAMPIDN